MRHTTRKIAALLTVSVIGFSGYAAADNTAGAAANPLLYAVAWKQTAAEYRALYYQGFNIARMHVAAALTKRKPGDRPLAIISDLDDTLVLPLPYWGTLVEKNIDFFDDGVWDKWIPTNQIAASPGAQNFLKYCEQNGVEIFYITSRDQGEKTFEYALGNVKHLGFPLKDEKHLTVLRDTSNKETRQKEILATHGVIVFLGDNLNDFQRKYYVKNDVDGRISKMEEDKAQFGDKYIIFPNPTDGHWMAAIFGSSEPEATPENREKLRKVAAKLSWDGK